MTTLHQSYVHGASAAPLLGDTIGDHFEAAAARWAGRDALIVRHQDIRWTWAELKARIDDFAAGLIALGLTPGERIGIWSPNSAEWTVAQFATARAGLILVNINPAYRLAELEYALDKVACAALITAAAFKSSDYIGMLRELAPEIDGAAPGALRAAKLPHLRCVIQIGGGQVAGMFAFEEIAARGAAAGHAAVAALAPALQFDDPINIQFTSGTTGSPKGATLTHHNILNNGYFLGETLGFNADDRLCIPVPLYHCFGMVIGNLSCMTHGAAMVYPSEAFDPLATLEAIEAERCTGVLGVPTMFIAQLRHPEFERFDLSSLRTGIMAGAPCPPALMTRVIEDMHCREILIGYSQTEASPITHLTVADDSFERRIETVGRNLPHQEVKIADLKTGAAIPIGEIGEPCFRGYHVMLGYYNDDEATRNTIDSAGWLHSGDLGAMDAAGYLRITGRLKEMIIRGGENIYPAEIEAYLFANPKIAQTAVFGVSDERLGEEIAVWVQLHDGETMTEDELRDYCRAGLSHFKVPRHIRFVTSFPMTVTGKLQKFRMQEIAEERLQDAAVNA